MGLVALSGFGGPRLRAPIEPQLIALAAVVLAGSFGNVDKKILAVAGLAAAILAVIVLPQLPRSFSARADYGVHWPLKAPPKRSAMTGAAGFNVLVTKEAMKPKSFASTSARAIPPAEPKSRSDSTERPPSAFVSPRESTASSSPGRTRVWSHVEFFASDPRTGEPVRLYVIVPKTT